MDAQSVGLVLIGVLLPFVTELVKRAIGNPEDKKALVVYFIVAFIVATLATFASGGFANVSLADPGAFVQSVWPVLAGIVTISTAFYHLFPGTVKKISATNA